MVYVRTGDEKQPNVSEFSNSPHLKEKSGIAQLPTESMNLDEIANEDDEEGDNEEEDDMDVVDSNTLANKTVSGLQKPIHNFLNDGVNQQTSVPTSTVQPLPAVVRDESDDKLVALALTQLRAIPSTSNLIAEDDEDDNEDEMDEADDDKPVAALQVGRGTESKPTGVVPEGDANKKKRAKRRTREEMEEFRRQKKLRQLSGENKRRKKTEGTVIVATASLLTPHIQSKAMLTEAKEVKQEEAEEVDGPVVDASNIATNITAVASKLSYEQERSKQIVRKLGMHGMHMWTASIVFYGRSKFLGYFSSFETALMAFDMAYHVRTVTGIKSAGVKFKGKIGRDIKLSGITFIFKYL